MTAYTCDNFNLMFHGSVVAICATREWAQRLALQMNQTHLITEDPLNEVQQLTIEDKFRFAERFAE